MDQLLAWRPNGAKNSRSHTPYVGNQCDGSNDASRQISQHVLLALNIAHVGSDGDTMGAPFEQAVRDDLAVSLPTTDPARQWTIRNGQAVTDFVQYSHLTVLDAAVRRDKVLRTEFGRDYRINPDVVIGVDGTTPPLLHAVISCKWSMRSDRVQNIRPEGATLVRHRRGRAPHFVVVTCEPIPTRIAAIAMTTGEVDAVYHVAFNETADGVAKYGTAEQQDYWAEMVAQRRLVDYGRLVETLTLT